MTIPTPRANRCSASSINGTVSTGFTRQLYACRTSVQTIFGILNTSNGRVTLNTAATRPADDARNHPPAFHWSALPSNAGGMTPSQGDREQPGSQDGQCQGVRLRNRAIADDVIGNHRASDGARCAWGRGIDGAIVSFRAHLGYEDRVY